MGVKNAPDEFGAVFQVRLNKWQGWVTKKRGDIYGRSPYEDVERSCGVTLFADDVFENSLLEKSTSDECEHTVARRMGEVRFVTKCQKIGDPVQSPDKIKASHRFLGIVYLAMLSMGAEIDQRTWATNRAWRELYGMWWNKRVPYKIKWTLFRGAGLRSLPHGPHCTSPS